MKFNLKEHLKQLKQTLKPMTTAEKLDHLWTYYKFVLVILVVVVMLISIVVTGITNANREYLISGAVLNVTMDQKGRDYINQDCLEALQGEAGHKELVITDFRFEDPSAAVNFEMTSNAIYRLIAMVEGKMLDYAITDMIGLNVSLGHQLFMDLREFMTEEELAQWEGKLIMMKYGDDGEEFPVAINISDTAYAKNHVRTSDSCYFAVIGNTPRLEAVRAFWDYLMDYEAKPAA